LGVEELAFVMFGGWFFFEFLTPPLWWTLTFSILFHFFWTTFSAPNEPIGGWVSSFF
jgi:hypothetical protein